MTLRTITSLRDAFAAPGCGASTNTRGRDYSHRKEWVLERLSQLTSIFTIDIGAYAVMSNHYHLVVFVDQARSKSLTQEEVYERWTQLFRAPPLVERWRAGTALEAEQRLAECIVERWGTLTGTRTDF